jgi:hypothetical protein
MLYNLLILHLEAKRRKNKENIRIYYQPSINLLKSIDGQIYAPNQYLPYFNIQNLSKKKSNQNEWLRELANI